MPRGALATQDMPVTGLAPTYSAGDAVNGHYATAGYDVALHVLNTGAGSCTVTLAATGKLAGVAIANQTFAVPATTGKMFIPLRPDLYAQSDGTINIDLSTASGVTLAVIRMRP